MKLFFLRTKRQQKRKAARLLKALWPALGMTAAVGILAQMRRNKETDILVAKKSVKSKKLLALAAFTTLTFFGKKFLYIRALSVRNEARGKGIGSRLIKNLEAIAKKNGHHAIVLFSALHREKAHRFYLRHGFQKLCYILFWKNIS